MKYPIKRQVIRIFPIVNSLKMQFCHVEYTTQKGFRFSEINKFWCVMTASPFIKFSIFLKHNIHIAL